MGGEGIEEEAQHASLKKNGRGVVSQPDSLELVFEKNPELSCRSFNTQSRSLAVNLAGCP